MFTKVAISALLAATGAYAASGCSADTLTVTASSDATLASCTTFTGNVVIGAGATSVDLGSVEQINGDLTATDLGSFISLSASQLNSISGAFTLQNLTSLSTLSMGSLNSVGTITWQSLPALNALSFGGTGVETAENITISDTFLASLDGISLQTVGSMDLNNNGRLTAVDLTLKNITGELILSANGQKLAFSAPDLEWASSLKISNVTTFSAPSLATVNGSAFFDSNYFTQFSAPNLTATKSGSFSFINNGAMTDLNVPALTTVGGGFTIVNNTVFQNLTLPKLADVGGAVNVGGNFTTVTMPSLHNVVGTFTVTSTGDIDDDCTELKKDFPESSGGNGDIQGKATCTSNNNKALTGGSGGTSSGSSNTSSAATMHINSAVAGLSFIGLLAQLL